MNKLIITYAINYYHESLCKTFNQNGKKAVIKFVELTKDKDFGAVRTAYLIDPHKPSRVGCRTLDKLSLLGIVVKRGRGPDGICYEILDRPALNDIADQMV